MWLFTIMNKQAVAVLNSRIAGQPRLQRKQKKLGTLKIYCKVGNYFLETCAPMMCLLTPTLKSRGPLSHRTRLRWSMPNYFGRRTCVEIECTESTYSRAALLKDSKTPSSNTCIHSECWTSMQLYKPWYDKRHPQLASRTVCTWERELVIETTMITAMITVKDKRVRDARIHWWDV